MGNEYSFFKDRKKHQKHLAAPWDGARPREEPLLPRLSLGLFKPHGSVLFPRRGAEPGKLSVGVLASLPDVDQLSISKPDVKFKMNRA
jgi:hypothetical protein